MGTGIVPSRSRQLLALGRHSTIRYSSSCTGSKAPNHECRYRFRNLSLLRFSIVYLVRMNPHLLQISATMAVDTVMFAYTLHAAFGGVWAAAFLQHWFDSFEAGTHGVS